MAVPISSSSAPPTFNFRSTCFLKFPFLASFPIPNSTSSIATLSLRAILCRARAANSHSHSHSHAAGPVNKKPSSSTSTKNKNKKNKSSSSRSTSKGKGEAGNSTPLNFTDFEILQDFPADVDVNVDVDDENATTTSDSSFAYPPMPLPEPPAGFVVDDHGKVLLASTNRLATIVDPTNNLPLECVIRRVFRSSEGHECMLLCPVDTPVQILKSTNADGWSAVSDEEVESILPAAAYALAKIHMHLVYSGYCYTARGGFCYTEEDIFDFHTDDGQEVDGLPTEGVEITYFNLEGAQYMIYTPSDPLLFVALKDQNGMLQIADDELLEDPAIFDAIDEETEFNALVEEEAALLDSMIGER